MERIFKSWKSYLHWASLTPTKEDTTLWYLYGRMLLIVLNDALCPQSRTRRWTQRQRELRGYPEIGIGKGGDLLDS